MSNEPWCSDVLEIEWNGQYVHHWRWGAEIEGGVPGSDQHRSASGLLVLQANAVHCIYEAVLNAQAVGLTQRYCKEEIATHSQPQYDACLHYYFAMAITRTSSTLSSGVDKGLNSTLTLWRSCVGASPHC